MYVCVCILCLINNAREVVTPRDSAGDAINHDRRRLKMPDTELFRPKALHVVIGTLDVIQLFNKLPAVTEAQELVTIKMTHH
jgi:hypothetical protein